MANTVYSASLIMTADVKQAKQSLQDLQKSLDSLMRTSHESSPLGLTQEIAKATSDVAGLKAALQSATNVNTGKLDLSKFSRGLDTAKLDIKQVASSLQSLGPAGQQAFSQLATSIMSAEVPLKQTNKLLNDFKTTLANTVKWQISSSMVNSLVGAMQHAYGYAQDLNKSLNNIRIVTGYSTDQMAKFAKEANNAARALSTTTTQYTDAALIYYQQGLAEKDIKARTDATIKMANVTGESAKAVSDYMTAIWNNFDNGSKSIEYYADVMTALGAATASSTDEIAAGLEKFAAVSETVGLSYEYATAALATVTAETRQSADVVGNSFKTLFSRIQGLNLGETMDDGTTLNKYSQALAKVGIDIKDTTGEIKAMDTILDELGTKWDTLSNDTQMALAQTVAGVRQYNQLISLMNNWDIFKINLGVAIDAEGTLQEQADIYAESWQAAADRVEAAFEDIYDSVLNDEFFIKLTDFFGGLINVIGDTIDGIGGMGGAFAALGVIVTRVFGKDLIKGAENLFESPTKKLERAKKTREDALDALKGTVDDGDQSGAIKSDIYAKEAVWQQAIIDKAEAMKANGRELNEIEKIRLGILTDQLKLMTSQEMAQLEDLNIANRAANRIAFNHDNSSKFSDEAKVGFKNYREKTYKASFAQSLLNHLEKEDENIIGDSPEKRVELMKKYAKDFFNSASARGYDDEIEPFKKLFDDIDKVATNDDLSKWLEEVEGKMHGLIIKAEKTKEALIGVLTAGGHTQEDSENYASQEEKAGRGKTDASVNVIGAGVNTDRQERENNKVLGEIDTSMLPKASEGFMALEDAISSTALVFTSFKGLWDTWNNQDATFGEKLIATFTTLGVVIPVVTRAFDKTNLAAMNMAISSVAAKLGMTQFSASAKGAAASLLQVEGAAKMTSAAMLGPLLKIVAVIALVTAAIAGIAIAVDNASYTAEEKLENAKQSAEEFKTSLEEAKNAAQELNSAFDNYNSIVDKLNSCTEGTREYRNALIEANNAAVDLLQTYPELYNINGAVEKLNNGLISITEKGQNYLTDQANFRQNALNYANAYNNFEINQLENEKTNRQMNINERHLSRAEVLKDNYSQEKDIYYKEEEGRATDSLYQRVRSVAEEIYKDSNFSPETLNKENFIEAIKNENSDITSEMLDMVDIDGITNSMIDLYQAEKELATSIDNNTMQMKLQNENAVDAALGEDAQYKTDIEKSLLGGALQQETDKIKTDILNGKVGEYRGVKQADRTEKLDEELLKKYNTAKGGKYTLDENSLTGGSDNRFVHLLDEAGNQIKVSAETFAETIASYEAMAKLSNGELDIQSTMEALNGLGDLESSAVKDFIVNSDFSSLTAEEAKLINPDKIFEQLKDNPAFEQIWMAAGFESAEDFIEGMKTDLSNMDFDSIFNNLKMSFDNSSIFRPSTFEGMSYGIQKSVASVLDEAFTQAGQDGAESLMEILAIAAGEGEEVLEQVLNLVKNFDWSSGTEEEFANQLYTIMGNASAAGDAISNFGNEMEAAGKRIPLDSLDEFISKIHELIVLLNDLKIGDIVSEDVVNQLAAQGIAIQDYAIKTYEGWKLISQIPTDDLQEKSSGALKLAQGAYYAIDNEEWTNDYGVTKVDTYTAAQRHLGQGGNVARDSINVLTKDMTPEQRDALFSKIGDSDEISRILSEEGDAKGTVEQYDTMLRAIMNLFTQGKAGNFTDQAIQTQIISEALSTNGLQSALNTEGFLTTGDNGEKVISDAGFDALKGYVSNVEELQYLLEDSEATALDFYKAISQFEKAKGVKAIAEAAKKFTDLEKGTSDYNTTVADLQKNIENTFGIKLDTKEVENMADKWTDATTEAQKFEDIYEIVRDNISNMDNFEFGKQVLSLTPEINTSKVEDALNVIQNELANNDIAWNCYINGDTTGLLAAMAPAIEQSGQLAGIVAALTNSNVEIIDDGMIKAFKTLLKTLTEGGTPEEMLAALDAFENTTGLTLGGFAPANIDGEVNYNTGTNSGGGGGSDKVDRDKLTDALSDTYKKKRDRLKTQYEGLDPESASKYIKEEIALLEEEQKILEEQIKTWKGLLKTKVQEFNQEYADELGFDLTLNDDGEIANLSEIYQRLIQMYDEGNTDLADKIYDKLQESAGIQASIDEAVQGMMDKEREQAELELKDITDRIDWRIKQIDYQIKRLNYYQEKLLTQAHGNKQTIEAMLEGFQYQEQEMLKLFEKGEALRQGIDELNAAKAKYPNHQQMFNEQILEYQSDLIDLNQDILELRADMEELVQEVLELALDEIDIQNERINKYVSMLDRFQNIIDLSGRSILDQALKVEIGTAKLDTLINKMSISKQTMEGLAEATKLAQEALEKRAAAGDETSVSMWENQVEELERELEAAQDDFLANWEEVLQAAADIFDMRVELTVQTLEQALSPFSSLSILEDRYNKEKDLQEKYLDNATKLYELNKLNRQLNQSITDENDLLAKSKLRDIQEEILAYQKAGVDMSQYDLDILQKKYDLRLAEIALMEAQNSKTSMRLIRDAAGNWTYAYDADQTAIDEALQSVEDATYSLKKASTDYIDEMTEEMIAIKQEFIEAIGGLDRNSADYMEQLLYLQQHYMKEYNVVLGEFKKGVEGAGLTIHDTWYGATLDLYNFEDAQKHFSDASDLAISELMVNYKDWQKVVEQAMGVAGTSWETFGDDTGATLDSLEEHIQALCDEISKLVDVLMEYVATSIGMVEEWQSKYSKQVDANLAANESYIDSNFMGRSGGGGQIEFDMRTDYNRVMADIAKNGIGYTWDGKPITSLEEAANYRDIKLYLASEGESILHESNGNAFTSAETAAAASKLTADIYDDAKAKYEEWLKNAGQGSNNYYSGNNTSNKVVTDSNAYKSNSGYQQDWKNPRSGWCSAWVTDIMHQSGNTDYVGGHAYQALNNNNPTLFNKNTITNNTVVGSYGGQYGHIGIYKDGYIYSTSDTGNKIQKQTVEEYEKHYGKLYQTSANASGAGILSESVYKNTNNIGTVKVSASLINKLEKYDTGGYTGTWGPYGRLALLHEKELVLNKVDTSNILDAVKISRGVDDKISDMIAFTNNSLRDLLSYIKLPKFETQPIEQTVQIQAEFPGVIDQYEIQEALSNLSNDASQYLNIQRNFW